ncbi:MAG: ParB N-terminal domain-containing protein [Selenomonadaceae bacterium]|nr:ParB N-terminal domain-containing protein [Selenomonadaceae bacterium]
MNIVYRPLNDLIPYIRNPRDTQKAIDKVAASIQAFGFLVPIVLDSDNVIVCGHTRLLAARKLGLEEVPTTTADDLTEDQIRAYRLVDNRVAEMAVWDEPLLEEALDCVGEDFDMIDFGFDFAKEERNERIETNMEFEEDDFSDEAFEYECPECGFHFSE